MRELEKHQAIDFQIVFVQDRKMYENKATHSPACKEIHAQNFNRNPDIRGNE